MLDSDSKKKKEITWNWANIHRRDNSKWIPIYYTLYYCSII